MFKPTAKEALEMHSDIMIKVLKDIADSIEKARMENKFHTRLDLPFDRDTDAGRCNINYVLSLLMDAGYEIETNHATGDISVTIPLVGTPSSPYPHLDDRISELQRTLHSARLRSQRPGMDIQQPTPSPADDLLRQSPRSAMNWPGMGHTTHDMKRANGWMNNGHSFDPFGHIAPGMVPEELMFAARGFNMKDCTKKELIKCCAKQIIEDRTGTLMNRFNNTPCDQSVIIPEECVIYRIFETVLPGMGVLLVNSMILNSDILFKQESEE